MLKYRGKEINDIDELECKEYMLVRGGKKEIVGIVRHKLYKYKYIGKIGDEFEYEVGNLEGELCDIEIKVLHTEIDDHQYSDSPFFSELYVTELDALEREVKREEKHQKELSVLIDVISEHIGEKYHE